MKCISSPALDDAEIMSYVEGEAEDAVAAHIKECLYCQERADQWSRLQNRLQNQLYRVSCPTPMELGDYHLRLLPAPQVLVVAQHLRECPLCRREVAELEDFLADLGPENSSLGAVKVLIARLINQAEYGGTRVGMALRGEAKSPLMLEADGIMITLDIQPDTRGDLSIIGQLAADDQEYWNGAVVQLQQAETLLASSVDDLGAFDFEAIPPGSMQMTITSSQGIVVKTPDINMNV